jgi:sec-independent protein translocase protein TatC
MIRRFLAFLGRLIGAPFRLIASPFRRALQALAYDPDETSAVDAFSRTIENPSILVEHLEALRSTLLRSLAALVLTTLIAFVFASQVLDWLAQPIGGIEALQAIEVTESVGAFMRVSLLAGFVLAFPYIGLEIFLFVAPGLRRRERLVVVATIPVATILFLAGVAFAYFVMLPVALPFLLNFMGIVTVPRPSNYIRFVTGLLFWIGIAFQFPLVVYLLAALGFVRARVLVEGWRVAIVAIAIIAAVITPTVDPVNMGLVMAPMTALYFLSIGLAALAERGWRRRQTQSAAEMPSN